MKYNGFILLLLLLSNMALAANTRHFDVPMGTSKWEVKGNRLYCQLSQNIPSYGEVIFRQRHAARNHLILKSWQSNHKSDTVKVIAKEPVYKRHKREHVIGEAQLREGNNVVILNATLTDTILSHLDQGRLPRLIYTSDIGDKVKVDISMENFQEPYAEYLQCLSKLLPFPFSDVKYSTLHFGTNSYHLTIEAISHLNKVAEYVDANPNIRQVRIDGYSDNVGRNGHNLHMSEQRAKAVRSYLERQGVDTKKIKITWHGGEHPIADNDTHAGRAMNRRVSVTLHY